MSFVIWLTGLSGAGKTTLALALDHALSIHTTVLDGDVIRAGLCKDLGFTVEDRVENIRRIAEVSKLMVEAGVTPITAFISPFESDRTLAKKLLSGRVFEIYVSTPLEVCMLRDVKGLYKKVMNGEIKHFTGITSPYEVPTNPDLIIDTKDSLNTCVEVIISKLKEVGLLEK